jgi:hypothetical protein
MGKTDKRTDYDIIKKKEKMIANLITRGYFLQDIFHHLKRSEKFETSLFNFYKLIRSGRYPLIDSALKTKKEESKANKL